MIPQNRRNNYSEDRLKHNVRRKHLGGRCVRADGFVLARHRRNGIGIVVVRTNVHFRRDTSHEALALSRPHACDFNARRTRLVRAPNAECCKHRLPEHKGYEAKDRNQALKAGSVHSQDRTSYGLAVEKFNNRISVVLGKGLKALDAYLARDSDRRKQLCRIRVLHSYIAGRIFRCHTDL